jgi:hypothetical protein
VFGDGLLTGMLLASPWAPDGRATFQFGRAVVGDELHVIWRRIGGHEIFADR